ncbi:MAG: aminoacyl-tRNA hydrolase [Blastocatellia bacterium]|nr:aminoacyl-tRNA hydrolase [Blastocatellia bacterium]
MKLVAGLGNPGREYEATWHNLGFMLIDRLFEEVRGHRFRDEAKAKIAEATISGERVLLIKPQTFMNLSGDSIRPLLARYAEGDPRSLIVACDDVALPFGMIRVRERGSAGSHNGLKSIIERLGSQDFARIRLGVGPDHPVSDLADFVLSRVPKKERDRLDLMLGRASDALKMMLSEGVPRAQSLFNERVKTEGD